MSFGEIHFAKQSDGLKFTTATSGSVRFGWMLEHADLTQRMAGEMDEVNG